MCLIIGEEIEAQREGDLLSLQLVGLPGGSDGRICLQCRRPWVQSLVRRYPREGNGVPYPVFLPGEIPGCGAWWAIAHGIAKSLDRIGATNTFIQLVM